MIHRLLPASVFLFFWVGGLWAQSDLVTLQKKEQERRKNTKASVLVIDNSSRVDRIKVNNRFSVTVLTRNEEKAGESPALSIQPQISEEDKKREFWMARLLDLKSQKGCQMEKIENLQKEFDKLVLSRSQESNTVQYQEQTARLYELEEVIGVEKRNLADIEQDYEEFLTQARREGVPPGWLRN